MRKPDLDVREVVCSETGKPMSKIPLWLADVNVRFVSEEAHKKQGFALPYEVADRSEVEEEPVAPVIAEVDEPVLAEDDEENYDEGGSDEGVDD